MKTLSQNTTSSACAPETDLQQLVATLVPDEQRISFWPQHFGLIPQWVTLEPRVFGWMDRLCEDYCGGIWNLYTLNNGGAFMAPEPDDDDDETWVLFNAMNGTHSQLINSIDILRARRATGLMTRDNYRTVNNITLGKHPEAKR
ncbi:antirestriction protein [Escherichia coli]|uniref:antirestriction protein n=1 Tax=Escherichia coli TaxID=562 RepID=UPI0019B40F86|nr:antirestriction protein [Escherichia coli]MBQ4755121.1 restriction endonuclease [Escherichia coli]MBQ4761047.1 restriction endonuclease [Escherichia coli]HAN8826634.1 restriction endonuclease [Escherichia coli]